ncbi:hypothetical protein FB45DRAFT_1126784, partial [Roridomyces roridus]
MMPPVAVACWFHRWWRETLRMLRDLPSHPASVFENALQQIHGPWLSKQGVEEKYEWGGEAVDESERVAASFDKDNDHFTRTASPSPRIWPGLQARWNGDQGACLPMTKDVASSTICNCCNGLLSSVDRLPDEMDSASKPSRCGIPWLSMGVSEALVALAWHRGPLPGLVLFGHLSSRCRRAETQIYGPDVVLVRVCLTGSGDSNAAHPPVHAPSSPLEPISKIAARQQEDAKHTSLLLTTLACSWGQLDGDAPLESGALEQMSTEDPWDGHGEAAGDSGYYTFENESEENVILGERGSPVQRGAAGWAFRHRQVLTDLVILRPSMRSPRQHWRCQVVLSVALEIPFSECWIGEGSIRQAGASQRRSGARWSLDQPAPGACAPSGPGRLDSWTLAIASRFYAQ